MLATFYSLLTLNLARIRARRYRVVYQQSLQRFPFPESLWGQV